MPLHAALDLAALRPRRFRAPVEPARPGWVRTREPRRVSAGALIAAVAAAAILLFLTSTSTFGATAMTPKCDDVNLRTGPSTNEARKGQVDEGTPVTVVKTVSGGSYGVTCDGEFRSGSKWRKISAIDGHSVSSLYGVSHVFAAAKLFRTVTTEPPGPTPAPTTAPSPATTTAPTPNPSPAPTAAPTASPTPTPTPTPSPTPTPFPGPSFLPSPVTLQSTVTFYGRGWGHGVGLSQYGAQGRALDGQLAPEILAHYYQGTTLGTMNNREVRVLVLEAFKASASEPVQVFGRNGDWSIDGIDKTFPADARLKFVPTTAGGATTWTVVVTAVDGTKLHDAASPASIRVRPAAGATLQLWSRPSAYDRYRGVLRIIGKTGSKSKADVINELPMETYLRGVVPSEVPAGWPVEALKAQSIAARSYSAVRLHPDKGTFDVYDDTRSQVYLGKSVEKPATDAAIEATAQVVLRTPGGGIANAFFHSTGGGATENNEYAWVSSTGEILSSPYSYLRGSLDRRPDGTPYDAAGPYATWKTATYSLAQIRSWFADDTRTNVGTLVKLNLSDRGVSGRLISVRLIGADGTRKTVSGSVFISIFNAHRPASDPMLRSTLFDLAPIS